MEKKIFTVLFIAVFATMMGVNVIEPLMAIYSESLGATGIYIGLIFASATLARAIFTPIAGRMSDHHGKRTFMLGGLVVYTIASFAYIIATQLETLIAVRFLQGAASAFVTPLAIAYIGEIAPKGQEGKYMGTFSMSFFLGLAVGPVVGGTLNHFFSMNAAFVAMGMLGLFALAIIFLHLPEEPGRHTRAAPSSVKVILRLKEVQGLLLLRFFLALGIASFIVFLPLYAESLDIDTARIGLMVTVNLLITTLLQRHFGKMADKHSKVALMVIGSIISATAIGITPLATSFASLLALNIVLGLGTAISMPANIAMSTQLGKLHGMGTLLGLLNTVFSIGMAVGPLIAGIVLDFAGLPGVFMSTSVIMIFGTGVFFSFMHHNRYKVRKNLA
jgi:MFS transporter, DHA1 family, multidrug resistance protein